MKNGGLFDPFEEAAEDYPTRFTMLATELSN
jgi:hypothetical protein